MRFHYFCCCGGSGDAVEKLSFTIYPYCRIQSFVRGFQSFVQGFQSFVLGFLEFRPEFRPLLW